MKRVIPILFVALVIMSWGALKNQVGHRGDTQGGRFDMAAVQYYDNRADAEAALKEIQKDLPAAKIVPEMFSFKIAGDYACTKFLHEDGHVY